MYQRKRLRVKYVRIFFALRIQHFKLTPNHTLTHKKLVRSVPCTAHGEPPQPLAVGWSLLTYGSKLPDNG